MQECILSSCECQSRLPNPESCRTFPRPLESHPLETGQGRHVACNTESTSACLEHSGERLGDGTERTFRADVEVVRLVWIARRWSSLARRNANVEETAERHARLPDDDLAFFKRDGDPEEEWDGISDETKKVDCAQRTYSRRPSGEKLQAVTLCLCPSRT